MSIDPQQLITLYKLRTHAEVCRWFEEGLELEKLHVIAGEKYHIYIPKSIKQSYLPMLCAHSDTFAPTVTHPISVNGKIFASDNPEHIRGDVLGADDRNGIWIQHQLALENTGKFVFAIFDEEECGSKGAQEAFSVIEQFTGGLSCLLGVDRRGNNDLACYMTSNHHRRQLNSPAFINLLQSSTGYLPAVGFATDVSRIAERFGISCVNFSVGFYNEHHSTEFTDLGDIERTLNILRSSLPDRLWTERFPC